MISLLPCDARAHTDFQMKIYLERASDKSMFGSIIWPSSQFRSQVFLTTVAERNDGSFNRQTFLD